VSRENLGSKWNNLGSRKYDQVIHVLLSEGCLTGVSVKRGVFQRFCPWQRQGEGSDKTAVVPSDSVSLKRTM